MKNIIHNLGLLACMDKASDIYHALPKKESADVGCGKSSRFPKAKTVDALVQSCDFNTDKLPFSNGSLDIIVNEQVIEHLHNTAWFLRELNRVLTSDGHLIIATENLASLPNIAALLFGMAPFSTQPVCNKYIGGFKTGPVQKTDIVPLNSPLHSGLHGHVRVLTAKQLKIMLEDAGFKIIETHFYAFRHYVLIHCIKTHENYS